MSPDRRFELAGLAAVVVPAGLGTTILAVDGHAVRWLEIGVGFGIACLIAFLHLFFLGLPAWFAVSRRMPMRWWNAGLLGLVIGLIPVTLLFLFFGGLEAAARDWQGNLMPILFCAACGASSGLAIRAVRGIDPRLSGERQA